MTKAKTTLYFTVIVTDFSRGQCMYVCVCVCYFKRHQLKPSLVLFLVQNSGMFYLTDIYTYVEPPMYRKFIFHSTSTGKNLYV